VEHAAADPRGAGLTTLQCSTCDARFDTASPDRATCPQCGSDVHVGPESVVPGTYSEIPLSAGRVLDPAAHGAAMRPVSRGWQHGFRCPSCGALENPPKNVKDPWIEVGTGRVGIEVTCSACNVPSFVPSVATRLSEPSATAPTELPPSPALPDLEPVTLQLTDLERRHVGVWLYLGAFADAVLAACPAAEVRVRLRGGGYVCSANLYREGGDRLHDSHKVHAFEIDRGTHEMAAARGRERGEVAARRLKGSGGERPAG